MALLGAGRMGRVHAEHLAAMEGAERVAVADVAGAAAERCAREFGFAQASDDSEAVLARPDVDAVLVCTATDSHAELVASAALHGKHVFCEKPLALDLASIDAALGSVDAAGVILQVGFNRRFDPRFESVREAMLDGSVGRPELLRITSRDVAPPPLDYVRGSGGLFLDMTIHDFDLARFLVGREARRVAALGSVCVEPRLRGLGDVDTAVVSIQFDGGLVASIDNSRRCVYGYDQRVELFGSRGLVTGGIPRQGRLTASSEAAGRDEQLERYRTAYRRELQAFLACIRRGEPAAVDGRDARWATAMALAAARSLAESRSVDLRELT